MRLVSFRAADASPHTGLLDGEEVIDLGSRSILDLVSAGGEAIERHAAEARKRAPRLAVTDVQILAPIPRPSKNIMCLGRNYAEHALESTRAFGEKLATAARPAHPAIFTKAPTSVIGPFEDIQLDPLVSLQLDWEVELALVVGARGRNIKARDAEQYIFGYTVLNDVTARDIQMRHGNQFFIGKSLDCTCPIGPCIVTADEISNPQSLELWTLVNGESKQRGNTADMLFSIGDIVEAISGVLTLEPGDIISTGTPAGVGHARVPPEYLRDGDVLESGIAEIGTLRNRVVRV